MKTMAPSLIFVAHKFKNLLFFNMNRCLFHMLYFAEIFLFIYSIFYFIIFIRFPMPVNEKNEKKISVAGQGYKFRFVHVPLFDSNISLAHDCHFLLVIFLCCVDIRTVLLSFFPIILINKQYVAF